MLACEVPLLQRVSDSTWKARQLLYQRKRSLLQTGLFQVDNICVYNTAFFILKIASLQLKVYVRLHETKSIFVRFSKLIIYSPLSTQSCTFCLELRICVL